MSLLDPPLDPGDPRRLRLECQRTAERLRSMSLVRLATPLPDGRSRAAAALDLAQAMADSAAQLTGDPPRRLPALPDQAAGDVLAVTAGDLAEALGAGPVERAGQECARAVEALVELRRLL